MRAKYLLTTISVLSLGIAGNVCADDVYVNLSVLDNLQESSAPVVRQKPLFPIISASDSQKSVQAKKVRKAKKTSAKSSKEKLVIPAKKEIKVEVKETAKKPENQLNKREEDKLQVQKPVADTGPFKVAPVEPQTDKVQAAPSMPIKAETLPIEDKKEVKAEPVKKEEVETLTSLQKELKEETSEIKQPNLINEEIKTPVASEQSLQTKLPQTENQEENHSVSSEKDEKPALLISNKAETVSPAEQNVSEIVFSESNDELSEENKVQIDSIINRFENAKENKIAIYSFNLDDGNDSFRKKRISLNRAIAVRSYLLAKGYKNFSIKVVNLTEANGKEHSVRIEELK